MVPAEMGATALVTGASGYVGSRLVPLLLEAGFSVRAVGRDVGRLRRSLTEHERLSLVACDLLDQEGMREALDGCDVAYYLVHSMDAGIPDFAARDRELASAFVTASTAAKVPRVIYLGGLGRHDDRLSIHLRSRQETGVLLRAGSAALTELRASLIIGNGSASFRILTDLARRFPVLVVPRSIDTRIQPVFVDDLLYALVTASQVPCAAGKTIDIGGPEIASYRKLVGMAAEALGLPPRRILALPFHLPILPGRWTRFFTDVPPAIARPLFQGTANEMLCENDLATRLLNMPQTPLREAIRRSLAR